MTFSLVARCSDTGMFGVAVTSSSPAVAARCAYTRASVGAVASQNVTNPLLGPSTLDLMERGMSAAEAIAEAARSPFPEYRQVLAIDAEGQSAIHSGPKSLGIWAQAQGINVAAGGNLLDHDGIPQAIVSAFENAQGHLGDRLLTAIYAGLEAGGEAGPIHSAGMQLAHRVPWPIADLRCDWTEACPIQAVEQAWIIYKPQIDDYIRRALDPGQAPSYGVPGDA